MLLHNNVMRKSCCPLPFLWMYVLYLCVVVVNGQTCITTGWFGTNCQYKCHCTNDNCDFTTGECGDNSACVQGWFGPQCQYVDLTTTYNATMDPVWLYDGDDNTCNDGQTSTVAVQLTQPLPFTWVRLYFKDSGNLDTINIEFQTSPDGNSVSCNNKTTTYINYKTIDIHCDLGVMVQQAIVTGPGIRSLCSLYISGGRNVALKQQTTQSTTSIFYNSVSSNAVDGNRDGNLYRGSCTLTANIDINPFWNVSFIFPTTIHRYALFNRKDAVPERLLKFNLTSYAADGRQVFTFQDNTTEAQDVYTVIPDVTSTSPVSRVTIRATEVNYVNDVTPVLSLCEVETYGDTICRQGSYGRECEHSCNYCRNQICFVSTGGCPDGCVDVGVIGDRCQTNCPDTYYGQDCKTRCSVNCKDQLCDRITGVCIQCPPGKTGRQCEEDCPHSTYGQDCKENCSTSCEDKDCDPISGVCVLCPPGKMGDQCDQECESETYGQECQESCSDHCLRPTGTTLKISSCNPVNGTCVFGCVDGYEEPLCLGSKQDSSSDSGVGMGIGIGVGICVLIAVVAIVGVYWYWKRSHNTRSRCQRPPGYDGTDFSMQDDHNYRELFRGNDDYNLPTDEVSQEARSRRTAKTDCAAYENTVVNHYEDIAVETSRGEPDGGYPNDVAK